MEMKGGQEEEKQRSNRGRGNPHGEPHSKPDAELGLRCTPQVPIDKHEYTELTPVEP